MVITIIYVIKDCIRKNWESIYDILASHGDVQFMIWLALENQDYRRVVQHYLNEENIAEGKLISK